MILIHRDQKDKKEIGRLNRKINLMASRVFECLVAELDGDT